MFYWKVFCVHACVCVCVCVCVCCACKYKCMPFKKSTQSRGSQIKPRLVKLIENKMWQEGENELLKYLGFGNEKDDSILQTV